MCGAQALGNSIGEMQGGFRKLVRVMVLLLALPMLGALEASGGGRALALALPPGQGGEGGLRPLHLPV